MASFKITKNKLLQKLELPEDSLGHTFRLQLIGNSTIISGCKKLIKYQSEEITVLTADGTVSVLGGHLKCIYFFENNIEIYGKVNEIKVNSR